MAPSATDAPLNMQKVGRDQRRFNIIRHVLLAGVLGYTLQKHFLRDILLPNGGAKALPNYPPAFAKVDMANTLLQFQHGRSQKIYERMDNSSTRPVLQGPETIVFDADGTMYALTETAKLVRLTDFQPKEDDPVHSLTAKAEIVKDLGMGRPLGAAFVKSKSKKQKGTLYIADSVLGLTRISNIFDPMAKIEVIASHVLNEETGKSTPILYANDVAIGPRTGKVYFTDSSNIAPERRRVITKPSVKKKKKNTIPVTKYPEFLWDTLYASITDLLRGQPSGRLLEYDPSTDQLRVLLTGLHFPNGVGVVDADETALFFAETFGLQLFKYHLKGEKEGTLEVLVESKYIPGYPDGADCVHSQNSKEPSLCYAVMPSKISPIHKIGRILPSRLSSMFRSWVMTLPRSLAPKVKSFGGLIEVNPSEPGQHRLILDPNGKDLRFLTSANHNDGKLYFGSLKNDFIGVYSLNADTRVTTA